MNCHDSVKVYEALKSGDDHLRLQLLRTAIRYTNMRAEWNFMTVPERLEADKQRTSAHNALIDANGATIVIMRAQFTFEDYELLKGFL